MPIGAQGQSIPAQAWELRPPAAAGSRKPAHRPVRVAGLMGYVDPVGVKPGEVLRVHLTAPAAYEIAVARLGRSVLLRPEPDDEADRAEAEWLARLESAAACRHDVYPGSYAWVDDAAIGRPCTVSGSVPDEVPEGRAAGGVWLEERLAGRPSAWMRRRIALTASRLPGAGRSHLDLHRSARKLGEGLGGGASL